MAKTGGGDVYVGHDDNVYRRTDDGQWQKHTNDGWQDFNPPPKDSANRDRLNQQYTARNYGNERAADYSRFRGQSAAGGAAMNPGGFQGGGIRGGGGPRR